MPRYARAMRPTTQYARSGDTAIAYQVVGEGPLDVVYVPTWISHIEHYWEDPTIERFFNRLTRFARLILFDRRGSGLSDPIHGPATLEEQMDDVVAVMTAAGSERAALFAQLEGAMMASLFAATYPERTAALLLYAPLAHPTRTDDIPWALAPDERAQLVEEMVAHWGEGRGLERIAPSRAQDTQLREWFARLERLAASPGTARAQTELVGDTDVRHVYATIGVPTLVMARPDAQMIDVRHAQYIAERVPGARLLEVPGEDTYLTAGDWETLADEVEEFLTGARRARDPDRVLATVLFTDIVESTARAAELGDQRWRELLESHATASRREIARYGGRVVKSVGDGFLAVFDGPARAIRSASAIVASAPQLGIDVRAGLHTGEVEVMGDDVGGLAVHLGARIVGRAGPAEVLVSQTVKDLVVGSGIAFAERGEHELRGVPGRWRLYVAQP
jgi:class 3 adenylate cyclase